MLFCFLPQLLRSTGLLSRCTLYPCRTASDAELQLTHPSEHIAHIDGTADWAYGDPEPDSETEGDDTIYNACLYLDTDTYVNPHSATAARCAAGGLIDLAVKVCSGELDSGFAVIRPPGHHADVVKAQGFCLYNNVAIAADVLRKQHPNLVKKVAIVDWDV